MSRYYQSAVINTPNMKFTIAVIVLCALQNSLVLGRTNSEVLEEFKPLIQELHNVLARESYKFGLDVGQYYTNEYQKAVDNLNYNLNIGMNSNQQNIENKVFEILAEYNMSPHDDQIQHCIAQKDFDKIKIAQSGVAGQQVCWKLVGIDNDHFKNLLNEYQKKQNEIHSVIERSVESCRRNSHIGLEMVTCLIDYLLVQDAPRVGRTLKDVRSDTFGMSAIVKERLNLISPCFNFVGEKSDEIMKEAIDGFRKCVVASQNN